MKCPKVLKSDIHLVINCSIHIKYPPFARHSAKFQKYTDKT